MKVIGTEAQKWIIIVNDDNTYSIISKSNGLALDIAGASTEVGAKIQTYNFNGTSAQKFIFELCEPEQGTQSAEDGIYRILSKSNMNRVFDITGVSKENGAKLQIWDNTNAINQKFNIEYVGEGYYKIKSKNSGKVLTIEGENPKAGSEIAQEEDNDLDTQKWILKSQEKGVYSIISKCGNFYMDIGNSSVHNGQTLQLKYENDLETQQFILVNEMPKEKIKYIEDGIYQISVKSNKSIDIAEGNYSDYANAQIWDTSKIQQQRFRVVKVEGTNYYKIVATHSAKALDVSGGESNLCANITQYEPNGTDNQYWYFKDCGNGYYNIISKANGLCLDIAGGAINNNGANVQLYYDNGTEAQKFKLTPINIIDNNTYEIETKLDSNKVVDIVEGSEQDGANAQLWDADNVNQQRFLLEAISSDTYKILAKHSSQALTVNTISKNVYQSAYEATENQQWKIVEAGNGYFNIISKANEMALDVAGAISKNGQNIGVYQLNNTNAQKFRFATGIRKFYEEGNYGVTGLAIAGDGRGTELKYYKIGKGAKVLFATFAIHGFEDSYSHDGAELSYIAEEFKNYLYNNIDETTINNWTIFIFPNLNPDGQSHGYTNNGPGRTTLFSSAPGCKGIDMNRNWSVGYQSITTSNRNYSGTAPFQAYEASALREFMLGHQGKTTITVDTHGWLNETIGDNGLGEYYRNQFGLPNHINSYGSGYLVNWARTLSNARSVLVELPEVSDHSQTVSRNYAQKYINATMQMLREN